MSAETLLVLVFAVPLAGTLLIGMSDGKPNQREAVTLVTALGLLDMSTPEFLKGLRLFFEPFDVQFAIIKGLSFGAILTSIGCFFGFTTQGGAEGVGRSTTRAVVVSSMAILVLDAFWAAALL